MNAKDKRDLQLAAEGQITHFGGYVVGEPGAVFKPGGTPPLYVFDTQADGPDFDLGQMLADYRRKAPVWPWFHRRGDQN